MEDIHSSEVTNLMRRNNTFTAVWAAAAMLVLILDTHTALSGGREGVELCLRTVIPSLFPFFILSRLLSGTLLGSPIPLLRPLGKRMGIPEGGESLLAVGFLGGYPVGAQCIASACREGRLSLPDGRRMLAFCNNAGPAFLFGIAAALFPKGWMGWALWGIHILSAILTALLLPGKSRGIVPVNRVPRSGLTDALKKSLLIMAQVCGWVVLFRVVMAFLMHWFGWLLPQWGSILLAGCLEISNGCCMLSDIQNAGLRFVLCSGFLAFGGLCVGLQTLSVAYDMDTSLYFPGKLMQTLLSVSFAMLVQLGFGAELRWNISPILPAGMLSCILLPKILKKIGNQGRNPVASGV